MSAASDKATEPLAEAPIPATLNLVLVASSTLGCVALLASASHTESGLVLAVCAIAFSFLNNTVFSLLHEAVHGVLHPNPALNRWLGRWVSAFFPTGLSFQRALHLGHHRRNRTPVERFDWIDPGDNVILKILQWYGLLLGLFWVLSPIACLAYLVAPRLLERFASVFAEQTSASAMVDGLPSAGRLEIRLEIALSFAIQCALYALVGGTPVGWAACYGAFALNWCALQYADHAWSPLDVREGAWNLSVPSIVQWIFLHYHLHLVHHRHPRLPWIHLPSRIDPRDQRPSFLAIYARMWLGPRRSG